MALTCMIIAEPGNGKSTSTRNMNPETTFIINVSGKPLPFKGWRTKYTNFDPKNKTGNYYCSSDPKLILRLMELISTSMPHINAIVIDDFQFISAFEFMNRVDEKGFEKFNSIGKNMFLLATKPEQLREDIVVFYLTHAETLSDSDGVKRVKAKTIGKLVDDKLSLEGLFTNVLYGKAKKVKDGISYVFETSNNGENTCRTQMGMFETSEIPNDLEEVRKAIVEYNN